MRKDNGLTQNREVVLIPCRLPLGLLSVLTERGFDRLVEEYAQVVGVPTGEGKYRHARAREPNVILVQPVRKVARKRWSVQNREHAIAVQEVEVYEYHCQVRWRPVLEKSREDFRRNKFSFIDEFPLKIESVRHGKLDGSAEKASQEQGSIIAKDKDKNSHSESASIPASGSHFPEHEHAA